jgi:hypothetical protein
MHAWTVSLITDWSCIDAYSTYQQSVRVFNEFAWFILYPNVKALFLIIEGCAFWLLLLSQCKMPPGLLCPPGSNRNRQQTCWGRHVFCPGGAKYPHTVSSWFYLYYNSNLCRNDNELGKAVWSWISPGHFDHLAGSKPWSKPFLVGEVFIVQVYRAILPKLENRFHVEACNTFFWTNLPWYRQFRLDIILLEERQWRLGIIGFKFRLLPPGGTQLYTVLVVRTTSNKVAV